MGKKANEGPPKPLATGVDNVELFDINCVFCQKNKILNEGEYHCKYCGVMCENCSDKHQKTPKQTGHWAQKIKRIRQELPSISPTFQSTQKCELHPKRHLKGYCIDHGELFCKECKRLRHYDCATETLEAMSQGVSRDELREVRNELTDLKRRSKKAAAAKKDELIQVLKLAEEFETYVRQVRDKIVTMLDQMLISIVRDKDAFCKEEGTFIDADYNKCIQLGTKLDVATANIDEAFRNSNPTETWVALKKLEKLMTHYDEVVTRIENDKSKVKFEFVPNVHLEGLLGVPDNVGSMRVTSSRLHGQDTTFKINKMPVIPTRKSKSVTPQKGTRTIVQDPWKIQRIDTKSTGAVPMVVTTPKGDKTTADGPATPMLAQERAKQRSRANRKYEYLDNPKEKVKGAVFGPIGNIKLTYIGRKEIMLPTDAELTCVTGSTFLPNGRLVLVDNHNKTLKLLNGAFEFLSSIALVERPWNVAHCYKTVVAVSYPYDRTIELINTGMEMQIEGKLKTDRSCHGTAFHKTEKWLYVACGAGTEAQIQAYSLDGYLRKVIIPKTGVFHEPCYMTMSEDCSKLFVSDLDNGIVGFSTKTGDQICQYRDPKIKRYWDVTMDSDGRVYVVTTDPDCIYVIMGDHNGQLLTQFKAGNKPCSVSYSPVLKSLVVTRWKVEDLEVLKFV